MKIIAKDGVFHLQGGDISYIMRVNEYNKLGHVYFGKKVEMCDPSRMNIYWERAFSARYVPMDETTFSLDNYPQEYPAYGNSDNRYPAIHIQMPDGSTNTDFTYKGYDICKGKPALCGLPAFYAEESEAETVVIELVDEVSSISVFLNYTVFENYNCIARSVKIVNQGKEPVKLLHALSMSIDFPSADYDIIALGGAWGREYDMTRQKAVRGSFSMESRRGATSHQANPFFAAVEHSATETSGCAYGFALVYSGNHIEHAEVCQMNTLRISQGINPFHFSWKLNHGEAFQTPECMMVFSDEGIGGMSRTYHDLIRRHLLRGQYKEGGRPVLLNSWEANYFDFDEQKILKNIKDASGFGLEAYVLDDGWFGVRNDDKTSLGDWVIDRNKLPNGLEPLCKCANENGMKMGLWFEPEMISPDSELYRKHPDWCIHIEGRARQTSRCQLTLDLSREDVCDEIIRMVSEILESAPIEYVKWDMNRHMTNIGSCKLPANQQMEVPHRYMLGLYRVMETITSRFPHILFESCSGGGGRFDLGMSYYMPQSWTSDDTDAGERLRIQHACSMVYPPLVMECQVSAVPNHQVGRITPFDTRGIVAMNGNFGYTLDVAKLTGEEKKQVRDQIARYKSFRHIIEKGDFYRIKSPYDSNEACWQQVTKDKTEFILTYVRKIVTCNTGFDLIKLQGLEENKIYQDVDSGERFYGNELMHTGILVNLPKRDFVGFLRHFKEAE